LQIEAHLVSDLTMKRSCAASYLEHNKIFKSELATEDGGKNLNVRSDWVKSNLITEDYFPGEEIPEEDWSQLSQSESEYSPSQAESLEDSQEV
jgi:hypothetical protein